MWRRQSEAWRRQGEAWRRPGGAKGTLVGAKGTLAGAKPKLRGAKAKLTGAKDKLGGGAAAPRRSLAAAWRHQGEACSAKAKLGGGMDELGGAKLVGAKGKLGGAKATKYLDCARPRMPAARHCPKATQRPPRASSAAAWRRRGQRDDSKLSPKSRLLAFSGAVMDTTRDHRPTCMKLATDGISIAKEHYSTQ
jgi:hypothetical protein